ncbi:MAG: response regulator [Erysipelotrichaceae bacterium]|nr:response regulator [Erysipelotrichaceae bacterium]
MYRVLVVEDELIVRKGLIMTTPWDKYSCKIIGEAKNGKEGLDLALKFKPDIIITDIKMPVLSGIEMIEEIRKIYQPVVIFITAFNDFEYAKKAIDLRIIDYLLKPFDDEQLDVSLKKAILKVNEKSLLKEIKDINPEIESINKRLSLSVNSKHNNIVKSLEYIDENYNKEINISSISEHLKVSESYLSHLFKEETNYTVLEYITLYRLSKACLLLKDPNIRIHEVASSVGYKDQRYFSNIFKKHLGVTPNYYKEKL